MRKVFLCKISPNKTLKLMDTRLLLIKNVRYSSMAEKSAVNYDGGPWCIGSKFELMLFVLINHLGSAKELFIYVQFGT